MDTATSALMVVKDLHVLIISTDNYLLVASLQFNVPCKVDPVPLIKLRASSDYDSCIGLHHVMLSVCTDLRHICQNLNQFGYGKGTKHGGLSEYTIVPARYAYLLTTQLEDSKAAILERKPPIY